MHSIASSLLHWHSKAMFAAFGHRACASVGARSSSLSRRLDVRSKHFLLRYTYVDGVLEKRQPFRKKHLELAKSFKEKGLIQMGGALGDASGALFVWECDDEKEIEDFISKDPYIQNGLVPSHDIVEWVVVIQ